MRQTTVLGLLACVLAATGMVTVQATRQSESFTRVPLADALGAPKPDAPLARRPAEGVKVRIDRKGFQIAGEHGRVSIASAAPSSSRWARYAHGAARPTSFGRETVVVTPEKTEQFLTVERRQGRKTWQWQLASAGQTPRVGDDGAIAFLERHRLAPMRVEPVAILDERGKDITPEGLRWSVAQGRHGWVLKLRLDDTKLPLPYVIDPAVVYRLAQPSNNGAAGAASITMTMPAGVVNNDLLVMHIAARGGSNMTIATPGGWTAASERQQRNVRAARDLLPDRQRGAGFVCSHVRRRDAFPAGSRRDHRVLRRQVLGGAQRERSDQHRQQRDSRRRTRSPRRPTRSCSRSTRTARATARSPARCSRRPQV